MNKKQPAVLIPGAAGAAGVSAIKALRRSSLGCRLATTDREQLAGEVDLGLFDEYSFTAMKKQHVVVLEDFARELTNAFRMIERASPKISSAINRGVRWLAPLPSSDPNTHRSHTSPFLPGVIFLSRSKNPLVLAEAIVHEYGHDLLNYAESASPLCRGIRARKGREGSRN